MGDDRFSAIARDFGDPISRSKDSEMTYKFHLFHGTSIDNVFRDTAPENCITFLYPLRFNRQMLFQLCQPIPGGMINKISRARYSTTNRLL